MPSINGSGLTFSGLASGIDTDAIIAGLTRLNQQRIDQLESRKEQVVLRQTTVSGLEAKLLDFQAQVSRLARSVAGAFDGRKATSSDPTVLSAAAATTAQAGNYTVTVNALARGHQLASSGFTDPATTLKQGTVTLQVGTGTATTVTVDASNNTLQGLASAINAAGGDARATVINDGSATPYRLLLTSAKTGAANTIQITNNLTSGSGAAIDLSQTTVQAAADASVTLGSGAGAVTVTSATNRVDNLIAGVTVTLTKATPGQPVTLTVADDADAARTALKDFVAAYNGVIDFIDQRDDYNAQTGETGVLLGNRDAADLQVELAAALGAAVGGVNGKANRLAAVGITFTNTARLQINDAKLDQALTGQTAGVTMADVRKLFALAGTSSAPGVAFVLGSNRTQPSGPDPYRVDVTQAAQAARFTAGTALAPSITLNGTNNTLLVKVNGLSSSLLTLDADTYTPAGLAAHLQSKINADATLAGNQVVVDLDGGALRVRSLLFGSASKLSFGGGSALGVGGPLGFTGTETAAGVDVAGRFLVNGQVEAATGTGQLLIGQSGNARTDGLQVQVTLTPEQIVADPEADLTVTQGLASRLDQLLTRYLDPVKGRLKTATTTYRNEAADLDASIARQNEFLEEKKSQLILQFAAMESNISRMKALGDQLAARLTTTTPSR